MYEVKLGLWLTVQNPETFLGLEEKQTLRNWHVCLESRWMQKRKKEKKTLRFLLLKKLLELLSVLKKMKISLAH